MITIIIMMVIMIIIIIIKIIIIMIMIIIINMKKGNRPKNSRSQTVDNMYYRQKNKEEEL